MYKYTEAELKELEEKAAKFEASQKRNKKLKIALFAAGVTAAGCIGYIIAKITYPIMRSNAVQKVMSNHTEVVKGCL